MPYVLDIPRYLPGCLNWSDLPETPEDSAKITGLHRAPHGTLPPVPFIQAHYAEDLKRFPVPKVLPDIFQGRWSQDFFISDRFKDVLSNLDRVEHLYQPVDLKMLNGAHFSEVYYALGVGCRVEAIDAENSDVKAKFFNGKLGYYAATIGDPFIQWNGDKISGYNLWIDRHYPVNAFISDELARALRKARITGLLLRPSAITGAEGRNSSGFLRKLGDRVRRFRSRRYDCLDSE